MDRWMQARRPGRWVAAIACAVALGALAPAAARAEIVFDRGADLYAADDDGSGAHLLVRAGALGMDSLGDPALAPNGTALLFDAATLRNKGCAHTCAYGDNAVGAYVLRNGRVRRLSGAPAPYPSSGPPFTSEDANPEPTTDGRYVYQREQCSQYFDSNTLTWATGCTNALRIAPLARGSAGAGAFGSACDDDTVASAVLGDPSPDPADPGRVAYVGCRTAYNPLRTQKGELIVAGPHGRAQVVVATGADGSGFEDPSWSPDGSRLVAYDEGGRIDDLDTDHHAVVTPGLYAFDPSRADDPGTLLIAAPGDGSGGAVPLTSPRFLGTGRIGFAAGGSVWSIPATCSGCTLSDATRLYDGGGRRATQAHALAWTAGTVAPARAAPRVRHLRASPRRVRAGHAAKLRFTLSAAAKVRVTVQRAAAGRRRGHRCVRPTHALRRHGRCTRWTTAARLRARRLRAGHATVKVPGRALRRAGRYRVVVAPAGGRGARAALTVRAAGHRG